MAKFVYPGLFTFCPRVVNSFAEGYNNVLPDEFSPIELDTVENAMAMFWRVKTWKVELTRQSNPAFPVPVPLPESYTFIATLNTPPIVTELDLVCKTFIEWSFSGTQSYPDGSTVDYGGTISIGSFQLFILEDTFYLPSSINIIIGEHHYPDYDLADGTTFRTEWYDTGATVVVTADATFSLFSVDATLIAATETENIVSDLSCTITPNEFWAYANDDGSDPTYNTTTGQPLA